MKKEVIICSIILALAMINLASAGVGIKWEQESFLVNEGDKTCLSYSIYNPWPEEANVQIELSEPLKEVLTSQEAETKLIPANTPSSVAIPVKFCFKVPQVYQKDCLAGGMMCKQECTEEQKVYQGEVLVKSVPSDTEITGSGGSSTQMSVSAPLKLKVVCDKHGRDFSIIYVILAGISLLGVAIILYRKYRKPASERKREKLERLKKEMKNLEGKK